MLEGKGQTRLTTTVESAWLAAGSLVSPALGEDLVKMADYRSISAR